MCTHSAKCLCMCESPLPKSEQAHLTQFVQERPQLGPHDTSLGLHQGNKSWCVVIQFVHESLLQGNCSNSPEFLFDLNGQKIHKYNIRNQANQSHARGRGNSAL